MIRCNIAALLFFLALGPVTAAEDLGPDTAFETTEDCIPWLFENTGHQDYMKILHKYIDLEKDIEAIISTLEELVLHHTASPFQSEIFSLLAYYEENAGWLQKAQKHYEIAGMLAGGKGDRRSLLDSIRLLIEMGNYKRAWTQAQGFINVAQKNEMKRHARVLLCTALYAGGEYKKAETVFTALTSTGEDREALTSEELYLLIRTAHGTGRTKEAEELRSKLLEKYPESPESLLIQKKLIVQLEATPLHLFAYAETDEPQEIAGEDVRIQTGLFSRRENAVELQKSLAGKGFTSVITEIKRGGKTFFRVLSEPVSLKASQEYIIRLKEYGFEGFLVFDASS